MRNKSSHSFIDKNKPFSYPLLSWRDLSAVPREQKEFVEELRNEWKKLWREKIDDKVRAEGIAVNDYDQLFIDKGTIIHATRDFKALNFKEILKEHEVLNGDKYVPPDPNVGGWAKFVKMNITSQKSQRKRSVPQDPAEQKEKQQLKKKGRGWLHI